ncbi:MAG: hypothetical protein AAGN15_02565 [Cyanobacteria bacterium J06581_3]
MLTGTPELVRYIRSHDCYNHPIFHHWVEVCPSPQVVAAFFFQLKCFCSATRYGWNFPESLKSFNLNSASKLLEDIVDSEVGHGADLSKMAGFVINRATKSNLFKELSNQETVEAQLKYYSDALLGHLYGYNHDSGLTVETKNAASIFERRKLVDYESTIMNLGSALALELVSNNHLIPGLKYCLIDSGLYNVRLDIPEMYYIKEHWGELGAEQQHENLMIEAINSAHSSANMYWLTKGASELLDSLLILWRLLDRTLLIDNQRQNNKIEFDIMAV